MERMYRFANKPGVIPGKPIQLGDAPRINDLKHVARIDGRQHGVALDYRKVTKTGAALVIGACETGAVASGRFEQNGKTVSFRIGGAF